MNASEPREDAVADVMTKAQEFASSWSLVGGPFDDGTMLAEAGARQSELRALVAALAQQGAEPVAWQPIEAAPRDGRRVLLRFKDELPARVENFAGLPFVGKWMGGHTLWCFAAPVGMAGFPDEWLEGWQPIQRRLTATGAPR